MTLTDDVGHPLGRPLRHGNEKEEKAMTTLYEWLQIEKGYTDAEVEETYIRRDLGMEIPEEVKRDIKEYTQLFIQTY